MRLFFNREYGSTKYVGGIPTTIRLDDAAPVEPGAV
jgi:hypothetical protein